MQVSPNSALEKLKSSDQPFATMFQHGSLLLEVYKPDKVDMQQPHDRDEIYVVISGTGTFINGKKSSLFQPGDFLFVPAGVEHRFVDFSEDFVTWVIFYGPEGGEGKLRMQD